MFVIEDEVHCDWHGHYATYADAVTELRHRAVCAWSEPPNQAPCMSWQTCGRDYVIIEFDDSHHPWKEIRRIPALKVDASGGTWSPGFDEQG